MELYAYYRLSQNIWFTLDFHTVNLSMCKFSIQILYMEITQQFVQYCRLDHLVGFMLMDGLTGIGAFKGQINGVEMYFCVRHVLRWKLSKGACL